MDPEHLAEERRAREAEAKAEAAHRAAAARGRLSEARATRLALEDARARKKTIAQRIQLEQRIAAELFYAQPSAPEEVQAALGPDEAIVLYGSAGHRFAALVLTREGARLADLGDVDDILALCGEMSFASDRPAPAKTIDRVRARILAPLALPASVTRLLVSPSWCLAQQPPALLFPERYEVCCIASASAWLRLGGRAPEDGRGILALGDPDYGAPPEGFSDAPTTRAGRLTPLPGTRKEAKAVGDELLLGPEATETRLRDRFLPHDGKAPTRWRAVHLACHGLVHPDRPSLSGLALTPSKEDDGLLTVEEIYLMHVPADLVVLSACDSGRGRVQRAEGIVGLTTAFHVAGARSVIASLWRVDDEATRELMIEFHRLWNAADPARRLGAAKALRAAQAHVRDYARTHDGAHPEWVHPYYWAAWQLWGAAK